MGEVCLLEPSCYGCDFYINNFNTKTPIFKHRGRSLYPGEAYCTYDKIIRLPKNRSLLYSKCPREYRYKKMHIYIKNRAQSEWLDSKGKEPKYIYRHSTSVSQRMTANKIYDMVSDPFTDLNDFIGYNPLAGDLLAIDNGLFQAFITMGENRRWEMAYPDTRTLYTGKIGKYFIAPYDYTYSESNFKIESCFSSSFMHGHFGAGALRYFWVHKDNMPQSKEDTVEAEELLAILQTGPLESFETMSAFCALRSWSLLSSAKDTYGFHCYTNRNSYFISLIPNIDSVNNVAIVRQKNYIPS